MMLNVFRLLWIHLDSFSQGGLTRLILKGTLPNAGDIVKFDLEPSPTKPGQPPAEI